MKTKRRTGEWITADGRVYDMRELSDDHLFNCIAMFDRRLDFLKTYLPFPVTPERETEEAYVQIMYLQFCFWWTQSSTPADHWPVYGELVQEYRSRLTCRLASEQVKTVVRMVEFRLGLSPESRREVEKDVYFDPGYETGSFGQRI